MQELSIVVFASDEREGAEMARVLSGIGELKVVAQASENLAAARPWRILGGLRADLWIHRHDHLAGFAERHRAGPHISAWYWPGRPIRRTGDSLYPIPGGSEIRSRNRRGHE